jgi:hypothetical protein
MTRLDWDKVNLENIAKRRGSEVLKAYLEQPIKSKKKKTKKKKRRSSLKATARKTKTTRKAPRPSLVAKRKIIVKKQGLPTSSSLATELERYLPNIIMKLARQRGAKIDSIHESITEEIAEGVRLYFGRRT